LQEGRFLTEEAHDAEGLPKECQKGTRPSRISHPDPAEELIGQIFSCATEIGELHQQFR
jgi:hypothetical protein